MMDQAERLRQIVKSIKEKKTPASVKIPRVIAVTSGKGGVGKTNFAVNFAISLSELGHKVVIIDADFGLANVDVMMGIASKYDLSHVIRQEKTIEDILNDGPGGIKFISGGSGISEFVQISQEALDVFVKNIEILEKIANIILIDTGAGISDRVLRMVLAANETILITTPEPTAITDAYVLAKTVFAINNKILFKLMVNKADNQREAEQIFEKFNMVSKKFLNVQMGNLGYMLYDVNVVKAVKEQQPFIIGYPKSTAARQMREMAKVFMDMPEDINYGRQGLKGYMQKLASLWNIKRESTSKGR